MRKYLMLLTLCFIFSKGYSQNIDKVVESIKKEYSSIDTAAYKKVVSMVAYKFFEDHMIYPFEGETISERNRLIVKERAEEDTHCFEYNDLMFVLHIYLDDNGEILIDQNYLKYDLYSDMSSLSPFFLYFSGGEYDLGGRGFIYCNSTKYKRKAIRARKKVCNLGIQYLLTWRLWWSIPFVKDDRIYVYFFDKKRYVPYEDIVEHWSEFRDKYGKNIIGSELMDYR